MKDRLVLIVGPSGSGKTTIAKELEKEGYNIIHSYTTRPPRKPDEWGHIFVDKETFKQDIIRKPTTIAYTFYNGHHYWATKEQYQGKGTSIYVIDPSGVEDIYKNVNDAEVITIFLMADESIRYQRICSRELKKYKEVSIGKRMIINIEADERIQEDKKIFSKCKCNYVVDASRSLEEVLGDIKEIIGGIKNE